MSYLVTKKFPCPYCHGEGSWIEVVLEETGEGPYYECGVCKGDGMIEIGGPIHQMIKEWAVARKLEKQLPLATD